MNGWINEWMIEGMSEMRELLNERMITWVDEWISELFNGWII